ncbi:STAS/SEC14 domain-containing protein [Sphingomonas endophytica]|uniref:STAS/SEC14 domain-containing protein n=1 Tax=Sphingomonas endophytica TaxID=869719 RepID=A0A147I4S3_9SPHN|nr:STAS/SEC14 domain-containing protein [Sphingomonas endophytica]KTT73465.1 hypothetical protein NS334_07515 [Sphingomonas endophytica]
MYDIVFERESALLATRWHRIFTPAEVAGYARAVMRGFLEARFHPGYRLLMDMSACGPQPQDTLAAFATQFRSFPRASRIAVVTTPSPVARAQILRRMPQPYLRLFDTAAEARAWVLA